MPDLKLHLGCGDIHLDGWVNIDARPGPAVDRVADIANAATLAEPGTVDAIYACHVLEHFGFHCVEPTAERVLAGWVSLLKPEGFIFISVPDLRKIGRKLAWSEDIGEDFNFMKCLYGGCEYPENRHFSGYTERLLVHLMAHCGLEDIDSFSPFAKDTSQFNLHGCLVSLNLCGVKP